VLLNCEALFTCKRSARQGEGMEYDVHRGLAGQMHLLAFTIFGLLAASVPQPEAAL